MVRRVFSQGSASSELFLALSVIGLISLFVIPLTPFLLDLLLVSSILLSVMTLLLTLYIEEPLEFSVFPSLLLFLTLYRLALNIASTRMILTRQVGGDIIYTFGEFVTASSTFVGLILFILLTMINFIIVSKGAGRIAEVAARFNLEALSGKQMAIDSEISAGILSSEEAQKKREKVSAESDFYGAMDGASKFVRGDAICACIITGVNLFGGFIVGVVIKKLSFEECWQSISRLTIGDGLVHQIPALLISLGAAIMVTRASKSSLGKSLPTQLFMHSKVLFVTALFSLILALIPGMPTLILISIAFALFGYAYFLSKREKQGAQEKQPVVPKEEEMIYPITIELSASLLHLATAMQDKMAILRRKFMMSLGFSLPAVHIVDNLDLHETQYLIKMKEVTIFYGTATTLTEMMEQLHKSFKKHISSLLTRQDVSQMLEKVKQHDPAVVKELIPDKLSLGQLVKILQNLLKEQVSIRDFVTILEAIADHLCNEKCSDLLLLTEKVRQSLASSISQTFIGKQNIAYAITIDAKVQQMIKHTGTLTPMRPSSVTKMNNEMVRLVDLAREKSLSPIVITAGFARAAVKQMIESHLPDLPVLAFEELVQEVKIEDLGKITTDILI